MESTPQDKQKQYHKDYYHNHYKNIIATKKDYCECCQKEFSAWNLYKHRKSKKHIINSLSEEDKKSYLEKQEFNKKLARLGKIFKMLNIESNLYK